MKTRIQTRGAVLLGGFLKKNSITRAAAGQAIGVADPTVCDWVGGKKRPRHEMRVAIETWSNGAVPAESWMTAAEKRAAQKQVQPFAEAVS